MIKAIIFDVGGVLIRTEDYQPRRQWEQKLGLVEWESEQIVFNSEMGPAPAPPYGGQRTKSAAWRDQR